MWLWIGLGLGIASACVAVWLERGARRPARFVASSLEELLSLLAVAYVEVLPGGAVEWTVPGRDVGGTWRLVRRPPAVVASTEAPLMLAPVGSTQVDSPAPGGLSAWEAALQMHDGSVRVVESLAANSLDGCVYALRLAIATKMPPAMVAPFLVHACVMSAVEMPTRAWNQRAWWRLLVRSTGAAFAQSLVGGLRARAAAADAVQRASRTE